jgi:hypothetical protein
MTLILSTLAVLIAAAAAVRSTWSPCGVSMLSTITPLAERAKGHRYGSTCAWFVTGATVGGLVLGGVVAGLAAVVAAVGPGPVAAGGVALVVTLVVLVSETGIVGARLPAHFRQVNERWLDAYRPWVYGAGFGFQIGTGVATYITTAAVYLMVVLGALAATPWFALVLGAGFGLVRGLAVTLTRRVTTPAGLLAFHHRFAALRPWADRMVVGSTAAAAVVLAVAVGPVPAVAAAVAVGLVASATLVVVRSSRRRGAGAGAGADERAGADVPAGAGEPAAETSVVLG